MSENDEALAHLQEHLTPDAQLNITYMQVQFGKMKDEFSTMLNLKQHELETVKAEVEFLNVQTRMSDRRC